MYHYCIIRLTVPSGFSTGWTVVAAGASLTVVKTSSVTVCAVVSASAVPTSVKTEAVSVTPGPGVGVLRGVSVVGLAPTVESVAA